MLLFTIVSVVRQTKEKKLITDLSQSSQANMTTEITMRGQGDNSNMPSSVLYWSFLAGEIREL